MWACLPPELWERIFAADTDAAALCFELNSSLKRTAQAFLLSQNILPTKLRRLFDETCSTKQTGGMRSNVASDFAKELLLASGAVYSKVEHAPDDQVTRLVWELFEENGGLPSLQGRIARERQKASYMQKCQGTSPADAKRKLRRGLKILGLTWRDPWKTIAKCEQFGLRIPFRFYVIEGMVPAEEANNPDPNIKEWEAIGLALVRNKCRMCVEYIESGGTQVSLEDLLQAMAHTHCLHFHTDGYAKDLKQNALDSLVDAMSPKDWEEVAENMIYVENSGFAASFQHLHRQADYGIPPVTLPWLADRFASTDDALAAAFAAADPEESASRLQLSEHRAARELQFETSRG